MLNTLIGKIYVDDVYYSDVPIKLECKLIPDECAISIYYNVPNTEIRYTYEQYVGTFSCNVDLPNLNKSSKVSLYYEKQHNLWHQLTYNGTVSQYPMYMYSFGYYSDTQVMELSLVPYSNIGLAASKTFYPQTNPPKYMYTTIKTYQNNNMFLPYNNKSLSTTNLYSNNINVQNNLSTKILTAKYGGIPGYINIGNDLKQIICSMADITKIYGVADNDDGYIINPGYKFYLYEHINYGGSYYGADNNLLVFDNTEGTEPLYKVNTIAPNKVNAIKVFWFNEEIIINGIS